MRKGLVAIRPAALRAFRKKDRLSQSALAIKATEILRAQYPGDPEARISESLVALIETGRRQPSVRNAEALAAALDLDDVAAIADIIDIPSGAVA